MDLKQLEENSIKDLKRMEMLLKIRNRRLDFAYNHHRNTHNNPLIFPPHMKEIYETVAPELVIKGSVQSLKSEFMIVDSFASACEGLHWFFVIPKYEARTAYVQGRINNCVSMVSEYKRQMPKGSFDNVVMKKFGKGMIKYVGSNVLGDFKEYPADGMCVEEVSECNQKNLMYGEDRLRRSIYQFKRYIGNPDDDEGEGIDKYYKMSSQKNWNVECQTCHDPVRLDWFSCVVEEKTDDNGIATDYFLRDDTWREGKELFPICPNCGLKFDRAGDGLWIPTNQSRIEGWWLTMMLSDVNSLTSMWYDFRDAMGDPIAMKHFYNSSLGMNYNTPGVKLTKSLLRKSADKHLKFQIFPDFACVEGNSSKGPCSMGIDVGKFFDVRISRPTPEGVRIPQYIGKVRTIKDLIDLGNSYNVEVAVIDSMPETKLVQDFQDSAPFFVWLCRYGSEGKDARLKYDRSNHVVVVDRTVSLDKSFSEIKMGRNIMPSNFDKILNGEYVNEMTSSVRKSMEDNAGNIKYVWTKDIDHQRHADNYDRIASEMVISCENVLNDVCVG